MSTFTNWMKPMMTLGIDLGKQGGFCLLDDNNNVLMLMAMPIHVDGNIDHYEIESFFARARSYTGGKPLLIIIEKVHAILGNSAKSMNSFGENNGYIKGLLHVWFGRNIVEVTPRKWQKWLNDHAEVEEKYKDGKRDTKHNTLSAVSKLYPKEDLRKNQRCKVAHNGITDAIGIALYGAYHEKTE